MDHESYVFLSLLWPSWISTPSSGSKFRSANNDCLGRFGRLKSSVWSRKFVLYVFYEYFKASESCDVNLKSVLIKSPDHITPHVAHLPRICLSMLSFPYWCIHDLSFAVIGIYSTNVPKRKLMVRQMSGDLFSNAVLPSAILSGTLRKEQ